MARDRRCPRSCRLGRDRHAPATGRGAEPLLLERARCLRGERRPAAIVLDCDAAALARLGSSVPQLHAVVAELGYRLFLVDTVVRGALVETAPGDIQPGNREAYVALTADSASAAPGWRRTPPLDRDELVRRVIDNAATDEPVERTYAAELMATGPAWLRADPAIPVALAALEADISPIVRAATTANTMPSASSGGAAPPESPVPQTRPPELVLLARNVSVRSPGAGFERPAGTSRPHELVLSGLSTHLRAGKVLGLLVEDEVTAPELLSALAGIARVADGELSTRARPLLVSRLDRLVEPALSVAENIVVLGVIFGGAVGDIVERTPDIAERAGLRPHLDRRLSEISGVDLGRLGLVLALEFAAGEPTADRRARRPRRRRLPTLGSWPDGRTSPHRHLDRASRAGPVPLAPATRSAALGRRGPRRRRGSSGVRLVRVPPPTPRPRATLRDAGDGDARGLVTTAAGKQTIALCMIVRNEAEILGRCFESVRGLIDSWVICDTGSTDATREVVRSGLAGIPGRLLEADWVDFGHNRSELMASARGAADYLLLLDADMTVWSGTAPCRGSTPTPICSARAGRSTTG